MSRLAVFGLQILDYLLCLTVSARVRENQTRTLLTIKSGHVCSSCSPPPTGKEFMHESIKVMCAMKLSSQASSV